MLPLQNMQLGGAQQQIPPPPPQQQIPSPNDMSLAGVLHFLQTEWRRYERERNEWEIERAEMRARIALLEGERRSFENIKIDLLRRVKMMEYALRVERSKQLQQSGNVANAGKVISLKDEAQNETAVKEGSGTNSPHSEEAVLPNEKRLSTGSLPNGPSAAPKPSQPAAPKDVSNWPAGANAVNLSLGKAPPGRDPRSRARSRDYLKQCLLEVSYLTSPQVMNPLPNHAMLSNSANAGGPSGGQQLQLGNGGQPQNQGVPSLPIIPNFGPDTGLTGRNKKQEINNRDFPLANGSAQSGNDRQSLFAPPGTGMNSASGNIGQLQEVQQSDTMAQILPNAHASGSRSGKSEDHTQLTAIFTDPDGIWRNRLREQQEARQNAGGGSGGNEGGLSGWDINSTLGGLDDSSSGLGVPVDAFGDDGDSLTEDDSGKKWKVRKTLRNHLDAVRAVAFHPRDMILASGGDDLTVKIWRMDAAQLASTSAGRAIELEPQVTLRGHSAPVTSLVIAPHRGLLYSASLDSTIRVWAIPPPQHTTYSPYEVATTRGELIGHTDAVWGLALLREGSMLVSCGADGMVKVWDVGGIGPGSLRLSWGYGGVGVETGSTSDEDVIGATAVEAVKTNLKWVAVGYRNAVVKVFEIDGGKEVAILTADSADSSPSSQVNTLITHPAIPLLVVGYEDKSIRVFDLTTFTCTHQMLVHLDAVTAVSLDPSGHTLVSGSHDNSVRFWDLLGQKNCIQEDTKHRQKGDEGVLAVECHPSLPFMASAGADGLVKIWASS